MKGQLTHRTPSPCCSVQVAPCCHSRAPHMWVRIVRRGPQGFLHNTTLYGPCTCDSVCIVYLKKKLLFPTSANVLAELKRVHTYIRNKNTQGASHLPPCTGHAESWEEKCQVGPLPTVRIAVVGVGVLCCVYPRVWLKVLNAEWGPWTLPDTKLHSLMPFLLYFEKDWVTIKGKGKE